MTGRDRPRRPVAEALIRGGLGAAMLAAVVACQASTAPTPAPTGTARGTGSPTAAASSAVGSAPAATPAPTAISTPASTLAPSAAASIPVPSAGAASPSDSGSASPPDSGSPSAAASSAAPVPSGSGPFAAIDPSLLGVLPGSVGGAPNVESTDAEQQAAADPDVGRNVSRLAAAFAGDTYGDNWVYTAVVDVRPEARTEDFYAEWQAQFDGAACDQAGGIAGHDTVLINGQAVPRTTCEGGVRTYHLRLPGGGLMVSISDLGPARYGEQELASLHP